MMMKTTVSTGTIIVPITFPLLVLAGEFQKFAYFGASVRVEEALHTRTALIGAPEHHPNAPLLLEDE